MPVPLKARSLPQLLQRWILLAPLSLFIFGCANNDNNDETDSSTATYFNRMSVYPVCQQISPTCDTDTETVAEIVAASSDGMTLVYTDSPQDQLGFVDITDPAQPLGLGTLPMGGEPTSVAVVGNYALAGVNTSLDFTTTSGLLAVVEIASRSLVTTLDLGGQPDSVAVSPDGQFAAVVIENERDEDLGDGAPPQLPAGFLVIVDLTGDPTSWTTRVVDLTGLADLFPTDPEPEYVDINSDNQAVVTLQENNHIVLVDLASGSVTNHFSAGTVSLTQIDATEDDQILPVESLSDIPREPDGVTWIGTDRFVTADEGDLDGGSRGFTVFDTDGNVVFSSGNSLEHLVMSLGHYPEDRSENKGNEPENADYGKFGDSDFIFVASERSSLVFVYDLIDAMKPALHQTLPAGVGPEGVLAIPSRDLLIAASEVDERDAKIRSVLNVYHYGDDAANYPTLESADRNDGTPIPWGAQSGLAASLTDANIIYSVQDSFYIKSRIFQIDVSTQPALITNDIVLSDANGVFASFPVVSVAAGLDNDDAARIDVFDSEDLAAMINADNTVNLDPEGIEILSDGFLIAHEGNGTQGDAGRPINSLDLLFRTDAAGVIQEVISLPDAINDIQVRFGFEGVAAYAGKYYVAFQREWGGEDKVRIGIYDPATTGWSFLFYPLDTPESQNGGWVGLSEITSLGNGNFMVVERDNQGGPDAAIKRLYAFSTTGLADGDTVSKVLVDDLMDDLAAPGGLITEKVEGATVLMNGDVLIVNDNDGVDDSNGETELLNLGPVLDGVIVGMVTLQGTVDNGTPTSPIPDAVCELRQLDGSSFDPAITATADASGNFSITVTPGVRGVLSCAVPGQTGAALSRVVDTTGSTAETAVTSQDLTPQSTIASLLILEELAANPSLDLAALIDEQGTAAAPGLGGDLAALGEAAVVAYAALIDTGSSANLNDVLEDLLDDGLVNNAANAEVADAINDNLDAEEIAQIADQNRAFTLQLLHFADVDGNGGLSQVEGFASLVDFFRDQMPENTLFLSSGDNWIPGPEYNSADDESLNNLLGEAGAGRAHIVWLNAMGLQASAVGNHDLDQGPNVFAQLLAASGDYSGADFPYLSTNLNFAPTATDTEIDPSDLVVADGMPAQPGTLAGYVTLQAGNRTFGVIGATTPSLGSITSVGAIEISPQDATDLIALAAIIQSSVDALEAQGVNKIILLAHMQRIDIEKTLATLLHGVDIIVAGGSNTLLADENDVLRDGDSAADTYPLSFSDIHGDPVLVVNTDADFKYLGRLVVNFTSAGVIVPSSLDTSVNGAYAGIDSVLNELGVSGSNSLVNDIADALFAVLSDKEGNVAGLTDVYIAGERSKVRTEESNMGNLTADANLWLAQQIDANIRVSIKNGGGIRAPIGRAIYPPGSTDPDELEYLPPAEIPGIKPAGGVSQLDIENTLRFNNGLSLMYLTASELKVVLEHGFGFDVVGETEAGQFPQLGGVRVSFDPSLPIGSRLRNVAIVDGTGNLLDALVVDGALTGDPDRMIGIIALNFLADGGDGYPFPLPNTTRVELLGESSDVNNDGILNPPLDLPAGTFSFSEPGGEQDAMAEYLNTYFATTPFDRAETEPVDDQRIQNLAVNGGIDTVFP